MTANGIFETVVEYVYQNPRMAYTEALKIKATLYASQYLTAAQKVVLAFYVLQHAEGGPEV